MAGAMFLVALAWSRGAKADERQGLVVVGAHDAVDQAWPLALAVYASPKLRPSAVSDDDARALAGEAPRATTSAGTRELAELRARVQGDDAASRQLLLAITDRTHTRGAVVLMQDGVARVFEAARKEFDAASYSTREDGDWRGVIASLERVYGGMPSGDKRQAAPASKRTDSTERATGSFFGSPWFWGALGAALALGGATYFLTRDREPDTIHVHVQVPR